MITKQLNGYKVEFYSEEEWDIPKTEYSTSLKDWAAIGNFMSFPKEVKYAGLVTLTELITWVQNQETESFHKRLTTPKIVDRYRKRDVGLSLYIEPKPITKEAQLLMLKYLSENGLFLGKFGSS